MARRYLIDHGFPDKSFRGLALAALKQVGKRLAGEVGDEVFELVGKHVAKLLDVGVQNLDKPLWKNDEN